MTDDRKGQFQNDNPESVTEETTDASKGAWQQFAERADDEKRLNRGNEDAETDGTSPTPDVDLLADSLNSLADTISGRRDTGEDPRTR